MTDWIQISLAQIILAAGTAVGTILMAWMTYKLARTAVRQVNESILVRKRSWAKQKIDYLNLLQRKIDSIMKKLKEKDNKRVLQQNFNSLGIEQDKINRTEVFSLFSEEFQEELDKQNEIFEKIRMKKLKKSNDLDMMETSLDNIKEITTTELDSSWKELKSATSELTKMKEAE